MRDQATAARSLAALYVAGATLGLAMLWFGRDRDWVVAPLVVLCLLAYALAALLVRRGRRFPPWVFHALVLSSEGMITAAVLLSGGGASSLAFAMIYAWSGIYTASFFTARGTIAHGAVCVSAFSVASVALPGLELVEWLAFVGTFSILTGVVRYLANSRSLAEQDALTGILNRRGLDRRMDDLLADPARRHRPLSVALVDLDHFKLVNERYGHPAGDELLRAVAARWLPQLADADILARYGGDEFVLVLPERTLSEARTVVEALRAALPGGGTCSAGLTTQLPGDTFSLLLSRADTALYEAKRSGRNRLVATAGDTEEAAEIWRALDAGEFTLHFQPIVDLASLRPVSAEALVRWNHPERGFLGPGEFIPVAEDCGAILALGRWVLDEACARARAWARATGHELSVSVNVSPLQLAHHDFAREVAHALSTSGLPGSALTLEVTEAAVAMPEVVADNLAEIKAFGVSLAIDDFGTGHSSLHRLRSLPFDVVKVDRSFVAGLHTEAARLVEGVLALARHLDLQVVAEGVETAEQLAFLRTRGCDFAQGYHFGRPVPDAEFIRQHAAAPAPR